MSLDPAGHIKLSVSDITKSKDFYGKLFTELSYKKVMDENGAAGWVSSGGFGFWLEQAEKSGKYIFGSPGLHHICFKAPSKESVDDFYKNFLSANNIEIFDPPTLYPDYTPDYYAVFFADPDGIKLEYAYY